MRRSGQISARFDNGKSGDAHFTSTTGIKQSRQYELRGRKITPQSVGAMVRVKSEATQQNRCHRLCPRFRIELCGGEQSVKLALDAAETIVPFRFQNRNAANSDESRTVRGEPQLAPTVFINQLFKHGNRIKCRHGVGKPDDDRPGPPRSLGGGFEEKRIGNCSHVVHTGCCFEWNVV